MSFSVRAAFKNDLPRVIRPDILLTETGFSITELDSVPGGIGLTAWLSKTYCGLRNAECGKTATQTPSSVLHPPSSSQVIGGTDGMIRGFEAIFGDAKNVHVVVSEEAKTYRPEMEWMAGQLNEQKHSTFNIQHSTFNDFAEGDAVYRFFELFDLTNVPSAKRIFELAAEKKIRLTPPPKPIFEEKMLFALLWNRNLQSFWRQELGEGFLARLKKMIPYTWLVDPAPLPPHAAIPELNLDGLAAAQNAVAKGARLDFEGVRFFRARLGRARRFSRQRFVARGLERGGGPGDGRLLKFAVRFATLRKTQAGRSGMV